MSNNNLTDERLSALIRVARDSLELYEMELPVIDDVMLALAELQQRRAAMLQGAEPVSQPYKLRDGWVAVPVEPTEEMLDSFEHDAMPAVFIDSMRERARMSRRHSWRAFLRAAPKLDMAPQPESKDDPVTLYPWLVSISFFDKELRQFVPFSLITHRYDDGLITKEDLHEYLREWIKGEIGDNLYTITFFGRMAPYSAPQQEAE